MAKNSKFWLGIGVIVIDGKEYGAGMPLPVDKLSSADLKKMENDGRIGVQIAAAKAFCEDCAGLKNTIKAKDALIAELEGGGDDALKKEIETLNNMVDEMMDVDLVEIASIKTDNEEKAALIADLKKEVKALKKEKK